MPCSIQQSLGTGRSAHPTELLCPQFAKVVLAEGFDDGQECLSYEVTDTLDGQECPSSSLWLAPRRAGRTERTRGQFICRERAHFPAKFLVPPSPRATFEGPTF
jgi:hypothetical protein